jgi:hypothetical protein
VACIGKLWEGVASHSMHSPTVAIICPLPALTQHRQFVATFDQPVDSRILCGAVCAIPACTSGCGCHDWWPRLQQAVLPSFGHTGSCTELQHMPCGVANRSDAVSNAAQKPQFLSVALRHGRSRRDLHLHCSCSLGATREFTRCTAACMAGPYTSTCQQTRRSRAHSRSSSLSDHDGTFALLRW